MKHLLPVILILAGISAQSCIDCGPQAELSARFFFTGDSLKLDSVYALNALSQEAIIRETGGFNLANDWRLRLTFRNVMGRRTAADTQVHYFPGFGYTIDGLNKRFLYSGGLSLQIHYKIR